MDAFKIINPAFISNAVVFFVNLYVQTLSSRGLLEYLKKEGVVIEDDHIVYTKGGHGSTYVNIKGLNVLKLIPIAIQMAYEIHISGLEPDVIVGVPHGADVLASLVAVFYTMFSKREVRNLKLMKQGADSFCWYKDHGDSLKGISIAMIEDVINTGGSLVRCGKFIRDSRCGNIGCYVVCDRLSDENPGLSILGEQFGADHTSALLSIEAKNYAVPEGSDPREYCPHCIDGVKINTTIGHGADFLKKIKDRFPGLHKGLS